MSGLVVALTVFLAWGLLPLFWKELVHISPYEVVCHRLIWSCVFTAILLTVLKRWKEVRTVLSSRKYVTWIMASSVLLTSNWLLFIWSVTSEYVLEASLGYYICPLMFTLLSRIFFRDTLRPWQLAAIGLASLGVLNLVAAYGSVPWIAIGLALLFAFYGLINKLVPTGPLPGLFVETLCMSIPATIYLVYLGSIGKSGFLNIDTSTDLLLLSAGVVTTLPLVGFNYAAKRLKLVTIGMCQFIVPTCFFILSVGVFHEPFTNHHLVTFVLIWTGIAIYLAENTVYLRKIAGIGTRKDVSR